MNTIKLTKNMNKTKVKYVMFNYFKIKNTDIL